MTKPRSSVPWLALLLLAVLGPSARAGDLFVACSGFENVGVQEFDSTTGAYVRMFVPGSNGPKPETLAFGPNGIEGAAIYKSRLANNRGNAYIQGVIEGGEGVTKYSIAPSWDCNNTGFGEGKPQGIDENDASKDAKNPADKKPGCWVAPTNHFLGKLSKYPHVERADYSK